MEIYSNSNTKIEEYPNIKKYLSKYKEILEAKQESRGENAFWFELYRPREYLVEASEKIICPYKAPENRFAYDNEGLCGSGDIYGLILKEEANISLKYLLAILNSKLMNFYYAIEGKKKGNVFEFYTEPLSVIPIPEISIDQQTPLIELVDKNLTLIQQREDLITSFINLIRISKQNAMFKPLKYFLDLKLAANYKINLSQTEILIDETKEARLRSYKVRDGRNCIYINVTYDDDSHEDVLKIHFDDPVLKEFFHIIIFISTDGVTKAYRTDKNVLNTLLNDIKIPRYKNRIKEDVKNIKLVMDTLKKEYSKIIKDKYSDSPVQELNLDLINRKIKEIETEIDMKVYKLYDMDDEDIKLIETSLK